jgi:hypothetical protein
MTLNSLANIPTPVDAQHVAEWAENGDGTHWGRYVRGTRRTTAGVGVTLCGWQDTSGAVERHAAVSATDVELDATALRRLAALALDAADELESLGIASLTMRLYAHSQDDALRAAGDSFNRVLTTW